ncbi:MULTISPECIES: fumarylacetoacetate hydrolase family protein [unclassified Undibacterium]|uniref:fumarylacetoacetate hydrolase family protein n=1 Tax=unclassified Undibacterium TaxID=2630295 RepID=UPI002AC95A76|nr:MULTISPECIES: fumarylacetoacetate hydrolase family protein [unclassified Undibacterium]MEB0140091.1 fumarylacetoacetate hydrolase family protein [Undibacterium sp. CCC2.1]MEB0173201.1 fumarylacetoacetate hydrolase family protein [Undibacterium sp. CCC1.1]MEB0176938.1 fumarylacetoacetate hydrolase family protein [Undibacterium sp. CCC3.4]MEB0216271.1 fumarylacetoacetate hydrolase family protein [Undibacterium sp. 5I2]WPX44175.1 fumarylacetoacetate hydrolase family protein [Undibacterium sp. 
MSLPTPPTLLPPALLDAAAELAQRRRDGRRGERLAEEQRPQNCRQAWALQQRVSGLLNWPIGGWKCALPNAEQIVVAPIYRHSIHQHGEPCPVWPIDTKARIEPELAFVFAAALPCRPQPYNPAEIDAAIGSVHLALELIGSRYQCPEQASFAEHLADGLFNQGLLLGPAIPMEAADAAHLQIEISDAATPRVWSGVHPAGQPRAPLYWLLEFLRAAGIGLQRGQCVITGSYAGSPDVALDTPLTIRFGELGSLAVRFTDASGFE